MKNKHLFIQKQTFPEHLNYARCYCRHAETDVNKTGKISACRKEEKNRTLLSAIVQTSTGGACLTWGCISLRSLKGRASGIHPLIMHRVQMHFILHQPRLTFYLPNWTIAFGHNMKCNFVVDRYIEQML